VTIDIETTRRGFPALARKVGGEEAAYLDGPGGTQVHESVIAAMADFMARGGSNTHGPFVTSEESLAVVDAARAAMADMFGCDPGEVVFGQNMTSLTYAMSRALARTWEPTANIVVTRLDHDGNVAPWLQAAASVGVEVRFADIDPAAGCDIDFESLGSVLDSDTALVAFTHASNATGTIPNVTRIVEMAHDVGALTYLDAVHYAPHGLIDVKATDTDFLVCSVYKWFGPHTGTMYGKRSLLESVTPFKLRPSPDDAPDRWETGTQSFESLAGVSAAVDYIASHGTGETRRDRIISAFAAINTYETALSERFLAGIAEMPSVTLVGQPTTEARTPTFAIDVAGRTSDEVAEALGAQGIFVWSGNYYAYEVMNRLGRPDGLVRVGFVHYNTVDEVDRVLDAIQRIID
jgi:cysteine desulfurase family protein (TIGR01976 family)